jgi:DNA helicase-2/ATP-dependent DNA helicase PcrA
MTTKGLPPELQISTPLLTREVFFDLVDAVLTKRGRDPLPAQGPQRNIVDVRSNDRVLQILAGPGSGKTEMIVWRVLFDLFVNGTDPGRIVLTTFTRRAASELLIRVTERSEDLILVAREKGLMSRDPQVHNLKIGTIHSLCEQILIEHDDAYRTAGMTVIDQAETFARMNRNRKFLGSDGDKLAQRLVASDHLRALFTAPWEENSRQLNAMRQSRFLLNCVAQHLETWVPRCQETGTPNGIDKLLGGNITDDLTSLCTEWEAYLAKHAAIDFATVQKVFLSAQPNLIDFFDHVFVDEFQDSNPIQFAIHTTWLSNATTRLTVVGDDDQALYRFRGSDIECFAGLGPHCTERGLAFRTETLKTNYRSTRTIVDFCQAFRTSSCLGSAGIAKTVVPYQGAEEGVPVRYLEGSWADLSAVVARELRELGVGQPGAGENAAVITFSAKEKAGGRTAASPAYTLRCAIEAEGVQVFNLGSKTAGDAEASPVAMLLGLLSYLVDPVTTAKPPGKPRRQEVWASSKDDAKAAAALSARPAYQLNEYHIACQKKFVKHGSGRVGSPQPDRQRLTDLLDSIRKNLLEVGSESKLTLSGLVARLLADPLFRDSGYTMELFRQALFTQLLEANIAPTRLTMKSLDAPLTVVTNEDGRFEWPLQFWLLLHHFGAYVENEDLEDQEVELFEEDAVLLLTHHGSKGLEFDHVYVAGIGRDADYSPVLRTKLFSGEAIPFTLTENAVDTTDSECRTLAEADREREVYVAMSRARKSLTILQRRDDPQNFMMPNAAAEDLFANSARTSHSTTNDVSVKAWQ